MDTAWLPHWTTLIALGCGLAGVLYPGAPSDSKEEPKPRNSQEKSVETIAWGVILAMFVLALGALAVLAILGGIFLAIGWSRSPWAWNVVGVVLFLWIIGRLVGFWQRLPVSGVASEPTDPAPFLTPAEAAKQASPADGDGSH